MTRRTSSIRKATFEGLHIEAVTIAEFEEIMMDVAPDLIVTNHLSAPDIAEHPLKDLIPAILWQRPETEETVVV